MSTAPSAALPRSAPAPRELDLRIEGLRAVAALLVALEHLWIMNLLYPAEQIPVYVRMWASGHAAVLVFFVLSGYVIGLSNQDAFAPGRMRAYLGRRALRLLPIFWIALLLTVAINRGDSPATYLATAAMLQNHDFPLPLHPPRANEPMWSLHYEAVYYLLFLVPWQRPHWFGPTLWLALGLGVLGWLVPASLLPSFIPGYAIGWLFWAAGWWLSQQPRTPQSPSRTPIAAVILLLMATHHFSSGKIFLFGLGLRQHDPGLVNLSNLSLLPACVLLVGSVARRQFPLQRALFAFAFAIPLATVALLLATGRLQENPSWIAGAALTAGAVLLAGLRADDWLRRLAPGGKISYAFYLVHMPLLFLVSAWGWSASSPGRFAAAAAGWLALSAAVAAFLELWLQPRLRGWLASRFAS